MRIKLCFGEFAGTVYDLSISRHDACCWQLFWIYCTWHSPRIGRSERKDVGAAAQDGFASAPGSTCARAVATSRAIALAYTAAGPVCLSHWRLDARSHFRFQHDNSRLAVSTLGGCGSQACMRLGMQRASGRRRSHRAAGSGRTACRSAAARRLAGRIPPACGTHRP